MKKDNGLSSQHNQTHSHDKLTFKNKKGNGLYKHGGSVAAGALGLGLPSASNLIRSLLSAAGAARTWPKEAATSTVPGMRYALLVLASAKIRMAESHLHNSSLTYWMGSCRK